MLQEYHIVFIVVAIVLLIISIYLLFLEQTKEAGIASLLLIGVNMAICEINYLGFFGIDFIGVIGGEFEVYTYPDMFGYFAFFFMLFFLNLALVFYCFYKQVNHLWLETTT